MIPNTTVPHYILAYVRRRNRYCHEHISEQKHPYCDACKAIRQKPIITTNQVLHDERLDLAAYLEYEISAFRLSLVEARYKLLESYPQCNCIVGRDSVLSLIIPYYDTVLGAIPTSPIRNKETG